MVFAVAVRVGCGSEVVVVVSLDGFAFLALQRNSHDNLFNFFVCFVPV